MKDSFSKKTEESDMENTKQRMYYEDFPIDFKREGSLMRRKLLEYLPTMIVTNISNLLLISVDSLVVGNILGNEAFAAVNIFGPFISFIGAISALLSSGISTSLSTAIGSNNQKEINRVRGASFYYMIIMTVLFTVIQIPIVWLIIESYSLDPQINELVWQYATGIMICTPFSVLSSISVYQLQIVGKMKVIMITAVGEGLVNLAFDLLFVGALGMGVSGAGYGTAVANFLRAVTMIFIIAKYTDIYKRDGYKTKFRDFIEITKVGAPDFVYGLMMTFQNYFIMKILLAEFGSDGGIIKGATAFCFSLTNIFILGLKAAMRPLMGLLSGSDDKVGLSKLMEVGSLISIITEGAFVAIVMLFPSIFYWANGIQNIPAGGLAAMRIYSLFFIARGLNVLIGQLLTNRKDSGFVTKLNLIGYALLPLMAWIISIIVSGPWLWFAYLINEVFIFIVLCLRYNWWKRKDIDEDYNSATDRVLYMTVTPKQAITASRAIRKFADEHDINKKISYRVALCMEEMVSYAESVRDKRQKKDDFSVQLMVRFKGKDVAVFTMLDDGQSIQLDVDEKERELTTGNYEVIRRLSKSFDYQYILDMNYSTIRFEV